MMSRSTNYRKDKVSAARLFTAFGVTSTQHQQPTTSNSSENVQMDNNQQPIAAHEDEVTVEEDKQQPTTSNISNNVQTDQQPMEIHENEGEIAVGDDEGDSIVAVEDDEHEDANRFESDDETPLSDDEEIFVDIRDKLAQWSTDNHITDDAMDDLLSYLKKYHFPHLPKTNKTLKADAKLCDTPITRMGDGEFCYFGLKRAVEQIMIRNHVKPNSEIQYRLQFGIDGLPLMKSSKICFWPILVKIFGFRDVLPVAIFCGTSKPSSIHEYMQEFIEELDHVLKIGMEINNLRVMLSVDAFIMDAPAKAFVMDIKAHNGLYGCPKCTTRGFSIGHRTVFPNIGFDLRTDDTFLNLSDPHHLSNRLPPLATIGIGCVSAVPIDYMHNVCLGVMKSLLKLWVETTGKDYTLTQAQKCIIDSRIKAVKRQMCSDFSRTPRPLTDLKWFKATELRLFLLYLGPFIFLNVMSEVFYNHFLKLHAAIRILCHPVKYRTENDQAKNLLEAFGHEFMIFYGEHLFVYNFHLLTHLPDDCILHGCLDSFSAFAFENFMQTMLRYVKKTSYPLQQFRNRFGEHLKYDVTKKALLRQRGSSYSVVTNRQNTIISIEGRDNFICKDNQIFQVQNIKRVGKSFFLDCIAVMELDSIYTEPMESIDNGVYYCRDELKFCEEMVSIDANEVTKVQRIVLDEISGFIEVLHADA